MCYDAPGGEAMKTLSIREMRAELGRLDELVNHEAELVITRRGRPIARVLPFEVRRTMPSHAEFRRRLPRLSSSVAEIRADREAR
jgi:prevent-host-death family protein